jgi:3-dehydroquinate dehydratase
VVSPAATAVIAGFGADGYLLALDWLVGKHRVAAG